VGEWGIMVDKAWAIYRALVACFGEPRFEVGEEPIEALIWTIIGANTNDINSGRAFERLRTMFGGDWDAVRTAPLDQIKERDSASRHVSPKGAAHRRHAGAYQGRARRLRSLLPCRFVGGGGTAFF
jgi:hypothetical protein